ncbi:MAG: hypothetical protein LBO05_01675 [Deltaproteobacteria bacterium]|jgi:hypothetical protein|nr:hypothetical protein [Deltaproteobacteria bacterium]
MSGKGAKAAGRASRGRRNIYGNACVNKITRILFVKSADISRISVFSFALEKTLEKTRSPGTTKSRRLPSRHFNPPPLIDDAAPPLATPESGAPPGAVVFQDPSIPKKAAVKTAKKFHAPA